jgi:hypothetical protein
MECVLAEAAENGRKATVTAAERALSIPHATFDRNYRHLIDDFRYQALQQAAAMRAMPDSSPRTLNRSYNGSAARTRTSGGWGSKPVCPSWRTSRGSSPVSQLTSSTASAAVTSAR